METKQVFTITVFMELSEDDESVDSGHTIDIFSRYMNAGQNLMQL